MSILHDYYRRLNNAVRSVRPGIVWVAIAIGAIAVASYNAIERARLVSSSAQTVSRSAAAYNGLIGDNAILSQILGGRLKFGQLLQPPPSNRHEIGYTAVAILSGKECTAQRSRITALLKTLQETPAIINGGAYRLLAIVLEADEPTASSYKNANRFRFPVMLDKDASFVQVNSLRIEPLMVVVDATDTVVMAGSPAGRAGALWPSFTESLTRLLGV